MVQFMDIKGMLFFWSSSSKSSKDAYECSLIISLTCTQTEKHTFDTNILLKINNHPQS